MKKVVAVLVAGLAGAYAASDRSPEAKSWWSHIEFLASDALEGRRSGSPGHAKAAAYIASQFDAIGLKPGGDKNGYLQSIEMETRLLTEAESSLEFIQDGKVQKIQLGEQANISPGIDRPTTVEAEVVFLGHALQIPEAKIDEIAGTDIKGKVVFYIPGAPSDMSAPLSAHFQTQRWKSLRAAGAIGMMSMADPKSSDVPWSRATLRRHSPSVRLVEPALNENGGAQIGVSVNAAHGDLFLAGTGHTAEELLELHRADKPLPRFPLKGKIRAKTAFTTSPIRSENVIGILPGATKEAVVISAHLDHLGVGGAINGDTIYNGAMDNASGIASVIEVAKALSKQKLKRTVVFLAATGEEGGLMGSKHFAAHPTVAASDIVADINLDMYLPLIPLKAVTVYGMDESDLGQEFANIAGKFQVATQRDPEPKRNLFIRSDQYSFIKKGVPALTFKFYAQPGSPEQKVMTDWTASRYHAPSDDLQQPVDAEAAVQFNRVMTAFITQVANREARPKWKPESFFRRFASTPDTPPTQ